MASKGSSTVNGGTIETIGKLGTIGKLDANDVIVCMVRVVH